MKSTPTLLFAAATAAGIVCPIGAAHADDASDALDKARGAVARSLAADVATDAAKKNYEDKLAAEKAAEAAANDAIKKRNDALQALVNSATTANRLQADMAIRVADAHMGLFKAAQAAARIASELWAAAQIADMFAFNDAQDAIDAAQIQIDKLTDKTRRKRLQDALDRLKKAMERL